MSRIANPQDQGGLNLRLAEHHDLALASLRYWDPAGEFAAAAGRVTGCALPGAGAATLTASGYMLVWRSPTETLLLELPGSETRRSRGEGEGMAHIAAGIAGGGTGTVHAGDGQPETSGAGGGSERSDATGGSSDVAASCAYATDGCVVDQTGGISAFVATGAGVTDLVSRLGSVALPDVGQSRVGRLADLTVCVFSVRADEIWLLVERVYAAHLRGWIQATLDDLPAPRQALEST